MMSTQKPMKIMAGPIRQEQNFIPKLQVMKEYELANQTGISEPIKNTL